jgi:hypothetical protein
MGDAPEYTTYTDLTLVDAYTGLHPVVRAARGYHGYGSYPGSIVRRTRQGVKYLEAEYLPSGSRATFKTKREAEQYCLAHDEVSHGKPFGYYRPKNIARRTISRANLERLTAFARRDARASR